MITAILVDDEENLRLSLANKLTKNCPAIEIVGMASNVTQAYELIVNKKPSVVFLDVEMPVESGFDLLRKFLHISFEVIFVTGYDSYAIDAINFCAIGYLLKPVDDDLLIKAVSNIVNKQERDVQKNLDVLLSNVKEADNHNHKLAIPTMTGIDFVTVDDIIRFEGVNKYTVINLKSGSQITSSYNIGVYKKMLEKHNYYMPHKSHLINLNHLKKYTREGTIILSDDSNVPVSTRKKSEFLEIVKSK
jgi:two-component system LytT family response regulator